MRTIGNIFWTLIIGIWLWIYNGLMGIFCCISIIFIPIGLQYFKLASFALWPFGYEIEWTNHPGKTVLNILWALTLGWENALLCLLIGCLLCLTIVGIPFGLQVIKMAKLYFMPLGATIRKISNP